MILYKDPESMEKNEQRNVEIYPVTKFSSEVTNKCEKKNIGRAQAEGDRPNKWQPSARFYL